MKKIFAVFISAMLAMSFAACSKTIDKTTDDTDTARTTTAVTDKAPVDASADESSIGTNLEAIENSTSAPLSPVAASVEEWIEINRDFVDEYCEQTGFEVSAKNNHFTISMVITDITDERTKEIEADIAACKEAWASYTTEQKQEVLDMYPGYFGENCDMPVPEKATEKFYTEDGKLIGFVEYSVD